jgi:hypothetical protein
MQCWSTLAPEPVKVYESTAERIGARHEVLGKDLSAKYMLCMCIHPVYVLQVCICL